MSWTTYVTAKCVCCGATRQIAAGEVAPGDMPTCSSCYSPMVAVKVKTQRDTIPPPRAAKKGRGK